MRAWRNKGIPTPAITTESKRCATCEKPFKAIQKHQRFCSGKCRTRACRKRAIPTSQIQPGDYADHLSGLLSRAEQEDGQNAYFTQILRIWLKHYLRWKEISEGPKIQL